MQNIEREYRLEKRKDLTMIISIITINYNNNLGLKKTIESVVSQTYLNIEYIIIDGGSTDNSLDYIIEYKESLAYWISEKDEGVYDAMNKGIAKATGEYILFLNSGDYLYSNDIIKRVVDSNIKEDIVYGNVLLKSNAGLVKNKIMPDKLDLMTLLNFTITHQAIFHNRRLFTINGYDKSYKIISDRVFYRIAILFKEATYLHINLIISVYDMHGISSDPDNDRLIVSEEDKFIEDNFDNNFVVIYSKYIDILNKYNDLLLSRPVKIAIRISDIFKKIFR